MKMKRINGKGKDLMDVKMWIMIPKTGWEYYVDVLPDKNGIGFALVHGFETEYGSFSMDELKSVGAYVVMEKDLGDLSPAIGWKWI